MKSKIHKITKWCLLLFFVLYSYTCDFDTTKPKANTAPNTTLANIPVENDTLYALVTLSWDGEDNDGFIAHFRYRYTSYYLRVGQSIDEVSPDSITVHEWSDTTETSVTIAFDSPSPVNYQIFEVAAIDNDGNVDPTPAVKTFFTYPTSFPTTRLLIPTADRENIFAKNTTDDWWKGVFIKYTADDADGNVIEYAWSVDNGEWNWTTDSSVYIPPDVFQPLEGTHTIKVISKDNTNLVDPVGDSKRVVLYTPTFTKDILIIDETIEDVSMPGAKDASVDSFYYDVFGGNRGDLIVEQWDYKLRGMISMLRLKEYKMVVWHSDNYQIGTQVGTNVIKGLLNAQTLLSDYLRVGGKLVVTGWRTLGEFMNESYEYPPPGPPSGWLPELEFKSGDWNSFAHDFLHINIASASSIIGNLNSITGTGKFSGELIPDTTKIEKAFPWFRKLGEIMALREWGGFTVPIYIYHGDDSAIDGLPCGLRYYGSAYDIIFLGFPLWQMRRENAKEFGDQALQSMGF